MLLAPLLHQPLVEQFGAEAGDLVGKLPLQGAAAGWFLTSQAAAAEPEQLQGVLAGR